MNVTRDVILDLAPLYLTGEASADSRALVELYLARDAELAEWMREQRASLPLDLGPAPSADLELRTLARIRRRIGVQRWIFSVGCFFVALALSLEVNIRGGRVVEFHFVARDYPVAALVCLVCALACFAAYHRLRKRRFGLVLLAALSAVGSVPSHSAAAQAPDREFRIDAAHSSVEFEIPFMYSHVRGRFDDVVGTIVVPDSAAGGVGGASAAAIIRVASLNTGSSHRDDHLRSADFFDAERFPVIAFRSERVVPTPGQRNGFTLIGGLTIHGSTRPVRVQCRMTLAPTSDSHNVVLAIFTGALAINRLDFGIMGGDARNDWFDRARSATMGDSVRITLEIHGWMADPANPAPYTRATIARLDSIGIDSAVATLRAAFRKDSAAVASSEGALDVVGRTLLDGGRVRDGFLWLHALARLLPRSVNAMVSVGLANKRMGDTARARVWYEQAMAADSLDTRAAVRLARLPVKTRVSEARDSKFW